MEILNNEILQIAIAGCGPAAMLIGTTLTKSLVNNHRYQRDVIPKKRLFADRFIDGLVGMELIYTFYGLMFVVFTVLFSLFPASKETSVQLMQITLIFIVSLFLLLLITLWLAFYAGEKISETFAAFLINAVGASLWSLTIYYGLSQIKILKTLFR